MVETIIVGIDGLGWEFADPLIAVGRLPVMAGLIQRGVRAVVRSTIPTISPVAWSSFITGRVPSAHRVFDWYACGPDGARRPVQGPDRRGAPFWAYLNRAGIRTGIMNVPATFPAESLDGFMTSGFDAPSNAPEACFPRSLMEEIRNRFGRETLEHPPHSLARERGVSAYVHGYKRHDQRLTDAAITLSRERDIRTLTLNYQTVDHFNHHLADVEHIHGALENIDSCVQQLQRAFPEATLIIMSDHGSRRTGTAFLLVDWLESQGFLRLRRRQLQGAAFSELARAWGHRFGRAANLAARIASRTGRLWPAGLAQALIRRVVRAPVALWPVPFLDAERSVVAAVSPGTCGFYFASGNGGRRFHGEIETARARLVEALRRVCEPRSGCPLFSAVHVREELFPGLDGTDLPDVIAVATEVDARPVSTTLFPPATAPYFVASDAVHYYGGHTLEGIGIFSGPAFRTLAQTVRLDLWDLPAVILSLHGVPIPDNFDGRVPAEIFTDAFRTAHPLRSQKPFVGRDEVSVEDAENEVVEARLRDLGYL
jgi:predicted AlkP superfamily phosphohydrolase/phosphomutase